MTTKRFKLISTKRKPVFYLSKAAFPDDFQDFVAVGDVVMRDVDVGALIIVIATIVGSAQNAWPLLCIRTKKIH